MKALAVYTVAIAIAVHAVTFLANSIELPTGCANQAAHDMHDVPCVTRNQDPVTGE